MNTIGIALVWCVVQVTLIGVLAAGLYFLVRRLRPAAAASVVVTGLATVVLLSFLVLSPWPRWTIHGLAQSPAGLDNPPPQAPTEDWSGEAKGLPLRSQISDLGSFPLPHAGEGQGMTAGGDDAAPVKNQQSGAAILWRALMDELTQPQATAPVGTWRWPGVVAVLLLAAMACGLGWLMLGLAAVRWQRIGSRPVRDGSLLELVDVLRAELGCRRAVEVRQSDEWVTAAMIGWRRPVLLLPADWTMWTADQRRAVLAHEIVHARSHDFIALLLGQLGLALHCYHPLLHWLIGRLQLEQELAADAAAAGVSGGQRQYLTTIAELALHRQDRSLSWPARTFLPTQTTFLRRIAMLRDSTLRFDRLSPAARLAAIGAVLLCGLLVAGLRGPRTAGSALADDSVGKAAAEDSVDTTYMIERASGIIVLRPAAAFARPELAALARLLETSSDVVPAGMHVADFRQITLIIPEAAIPSGRREIGVLQWVKPVAEKWFRERTSNLKYTGTEHKGKKIYVSSPSGHALLICDDYTMIEAGSEQAMDVYLEGKPGALPKWLPAKAWASFRNDHFVTAADTAMIRRDIKGLVDHSLPIMQTALLPISSLCENATWLGAGASLDDKLALHAWATGKDADSSERLRRTAEALKTLAESVVKSFRTPSGTGPQPARGVMPTFLDETDRLLANLKFQQQGNDMRLQTSVELDKARLGALASAIVAATHLEPPDASTKQGMMVLVEDFFHHNYRDLTSRETLEWGEIAKTKDGNFSIRYKYRARFWYGEPRIMNQIFTFDPKGSYVSVDDMEKHPPATPARVYEVRKKVSDFPNREDLMTPEAAYASIHRALAAEGTAAWPRLSVPALAAHMPAGVKAPLPKEAADRLLGAEILEVHVWGGDHAVVIAQEDASESQGSCMDMRWLIRMDGRWLNDGNDSRGTIEGARKKVEQSRSYEPAAEVKGDPASTAHDPGASAGGKPGAPVAEAFGDSAKIATTNTKAAVVPAPVSEAVRKQIEALAAAAEAAPKAASVYIVAEMRTPPADNFSCIISKCELVPIKIWKQFGDKPKWRVEKPQRVAVMDGDSTVMLMRQDWVTKFPHPAQSAFDNYWLLGLCSSKEIIAHEFRDALAKGWDVRLADETSAAGEKKVVVTIEAKSGLPDDDYVKKKFFMAAGMRLVYRFHAKTVRLEAFDAYLHQSDGDVKVFTLGHIEYDQPIDPKVFTLVIPRTAQEDQEPQRLPDNEKYEKMTPLEAARAFFAACAKEDWDEAAKFLSPLNDDAKKQLGGLKVVRLGEPFKSKDYPGWFVPYEIKSKDGRTQSHNLAIRNDNPAKRYQVDGGL